MKQKATPKKVRRRKKSPAARFRPFWIPIAVAALAAAFGGYYAATWPGFDVRAVSVTGNRVVSSRQILAAARIALHENVWLQNMNAAAKRIEAIPYVQSASIHRTLPATVRISVRERTPFARLRSGSAFVLVDRDLRVLQTAPTASRLPLLVVESSSTLSLGTFLKHGAAVRLRNDEEALAGAGIAVGRLQFDAYGDLEAVTPGGVRLLLGDDRTLEHKVALVRPILSQTSAGGRKVAAIDLRALKAPVVVFRH